MEKQELLDRLNKEYEYRCNQDKHGIDGAIDVATGLFDAIYWVEQLSEPKECFLETFEPDIPEGYLTTCDIKTRCSECKTQIFGLQEGQKFCQFCGAKIKQ